MQDIQIGDKRFDDKFIIKSTETETIKSLLSKDVTKDLILSIPEISIKIESNLSASCSIPDSSLELQLSTQETCFDQHQINNLFALAKHLLDSFHNSGLVKAEKARHYYK